MEQTKRKRDNIPCGSQLSQHFDPQLEQAAAMAKYLEHFWRKTRCSTTLKLVVCSAVVIYGLEALQFTESLGSKLTKFHMKDLRKIMQILMDRANTYEQVYLQATMQVFPEQSGTI